MDMFDCSISSTLVELCVASEGRVDPRLIGVLKLEVRLNELAATPFVSSNSKSMLHLYFLDNGSIILFGSLCELYVCLVNFDVISFISVSRIHSKFFKAALSVCIMRDQSRTDCNLTYSHINLNL